MVTEPVVVAEGEPAPAFVNVATRLTAEVAEALVSWSIVEV
jgi:hypothetical protein